VNITARGLLKQPADPNVFNQVISCGHLDQRCSRRPIDGVQPELSGKLQLYDTNSQASRQLQSSNPQVHTVLRLFTRPEMSMSRGGYMGSRYRYDDFDLAAIPTAFVPREQIECLRLCLNELHQAFEDRKEAGVLDIRDEIDVTSGTCSPSHVHR
jgi:hypothetical protein